MIIRDATNDEIHFIREQRVAAYEEHAIKIPLGHWEALKRAILTESELQPGIERIVAEMNGEILGSVVLFAAKSNAYEGNVAEFEYPEIRMLAVAPFARGKGVAKALIHECIQRSKLKGDQSIGLHTGEFMTNAMGLYKSLGFERLPEYDFEPAGDGIMVKAYRLMID